MCVFSDGGAWTLFVMDGRVTLHANRRRQFSGCLTGMAFLSCKLECFLSILEFVFQAVAPLKRKHRMPPTMRSTRRFRTDSSSSTNLCKSIRSGRCTKSSPAVSSVPGATDFTHDLALCPEFFVCRGYRGHKPSLRLDRQMRAFSLFPSATLSKSVSGFSAPCAFFPHTPRS